MECFMNRRAEIYWSWVHNDHDTARTAQLNNCNESSVRGRIAEFLNEAVPDLQNKGMTLDEIHAYLKTPDIDRIKRRLHDIEDMMQPVSYPQQVNHYPKRASRYQDVIESLPMYQMPPPLSLTGDFVVTGDWQIPTTDYEFMKRVMHVGMLFLTHPRKLIICGDFINGDAFSNYPKLISQPTFTSEINTGRRVIKDLLLIFDEIYIAQGNHEDRVPKRTNSEMTSEMLFDLMTTDDRVTITPWGHIDFESNGESYCATHALNYSINQTKVAESMAWKIQKHIIQHHEHHFSIGYDRYKNFLTINNGGIFDPKMMGYKQMRKTKHAEMAQGFTLIKNGSPKLFGQYPFTDWSPIDSLLEQYMSRIPNSVKAVI
jgi:hypothetical protein